MIESVVLQDFWIISSLQISLDGEQTVTAKISFESHAESHGVGIKSFRVDNGRFAEQ